MNAGISFSPLGQAGGSNQASGQPANRPTQAPVQDAIRLLSLKLPTNVGPTAPSGVLGGPTPLGAQMGNAIADNWLKGLYTGQPAGRQAVRPVPQYQQTVDQGGGQNMGAIFSQLLQQLGMPSFAEQAPPSAARASVQFGQDGDVLASLMGGLGGAAPTQDRQIQALGPRTSEGAGGWTGQLPGLVQPGGGSFNEFTTQQPQPAGGFPPNPAGGFGGFDFQNPF